MDWFERLTGLREAEVGYAGVQDRLWVEDGRLRSKAGGRAAAVGRLETPSLAELRAQADTADLWATGAPRRLRVREQVGDVRALHRDSALAGALFQVASQFNLLEMPGPAVDPEAGVTGYAHDLTQGPACAQAAGAATIFRNYLVPVDGRVGQSRTRQLDLLADVGAALAARTGRSVSALWTMQNGYALARGEGLAAIGAWLAGAEPAERDAVRAALRVGVQWDVEVTDAPQGQAPLVSQVFCSALPVAYGEPPAERWAPLARLVLEGAYEATLWAAALNAARGASQVVLLTRLGGGVFGNDGAWIDAALGRALTTVAHLDLEVRLVSYGTSQPESQALAARWAG